MVERGAVVWADLNPVIGREQGGRRPVLIASGGNFNAKSRTAIAFAITNKPQRLEFPFTAPMPVGVTPKPSWVKLTQVRTVAIERLGSAIGSVPPAFVRQCMAGLLVHCSD